MLQFKYVNQDCLGVTVVLCNTVSVGVTHIGTVLGVTRHHYGVDGILFVTMSWCPIIPTLDGSGYTPHFVFCRGICWIYPGFGKWKFDFVLLTLGLYIIVDTYIVLLVYVYGSYSFYMVLKLPSGQIAWYLFWQIYTWIPMLIAICHSFFNLSVLLLLNGPHQDNSGGQCANYIINKPIVRHGKSFWLWL